MRYAIVESGGKQYRAVEGKPIEVDRLPDQAGAKLDLKTLLMADGEDVMVGTPTVSGIEVKATVVDHFRGEKIFRFKYAPKKRIRVRGGHRQQYTRLMVDFIGKPGETRVIEKPEPKPVVVEEKAEKPEPKPEVEKVEKPAPAKAKEAAAKKAEKPETAPVKKSSTPKKSSK